MNRRGFALPAAIGGLVIVGVLVTGGFYMARQELRIGIASEHASLAVSLAQSAANDVLISETSAMASMSTWDTTTFSDTVTDGVTEVTVTKLATRLYFLDSQATITKGGALWAGATRRVGLVTRINTANIEPPAALTTQGNLTYGGSSVINGNDAIPDGSDGGQANWGSYCDASDLENKPGILIDDTTNIDWTGNRNKIEGQMTGDPLFDQDTTITVESLLSFGDMSWDDLVDLADVTINGNSNPGQIQPSVTAGVCNYNVNTNWGAPLNSASPCFSYFPIIHLNNTSEVTLNQGSGQGILLVENDVRVNGGFEFYGPVFIKGTLTTNGSGGHFWGGVVAANADLDTNTVLGNAVINFSSCAVSRALLNNSSLTKMRPIAMRSWVDLTNVVN